MRIISWHRYRQYYSDGNTVVNGLLIPTGKRLISRSPLGVLSADVSALKQRGHNLYGFRNLLPVTLRHKRNCYRFDQRYNFKKYSLLPLLSGLGLPRHPGTGLDPGLSCCGDFVQPAVSWFRLNSSCCCSPEVIHLLSCETPAPLIVAFASMCHDYIDYCLTILDKRYHIW